MQRVLTQASPTLADVVQPIVYDAYGRQAKEYLSYTAGSGGAYRPDALAELSSFYTKGSAGAAADGSRATTSVPFAETLFEASPLNRVVEQAAAGVYYKVERDQEGNSTGRGRTMKTSRRANTGPTAPAGTVADRVRLFSYAPGPGGSFGTVSAPGHFPAGALYVTQTEDEHRFLTLAFTDKQGQQLLRKVQTGLPVPDGLLTDAQFANTYYIYDEPGQLRMVIQPEGSKLISGSFSPDATFVRRWCFTYHYDGRGRVVEKTVPGAGRMHYVYNRRDELILTQDSVQGPKREWSFTRYDALGRPVLSGRYVHPARVSRATMQALANAAAGQFESRSAANYSAQHGYTLHQAFPALDTVHRPDPHRPLLRRPQL